MQPEGLTTTGFDQDDFVMIPYTTAMKNGWRIFWEENASGQRV